MVFHRSDGWAMLLGVVLAGCSQEEALTVCTMEFRTIGVTVVDTLSVPVLDATVTSRLRRTGEVLASADGTPQNDGFYAIVSDGVKQKIRQGGDSVDVVVQRTGNVPAAATYFIISGCHVGKVSGPNTLVLR